MIQHKFQHKLLTLQKTWVPLLEIIQKLDVQISRVLVVAMKLCICLGTFAEKFHHDLQHAKWALHPRNYHRKLEAWIGENLQKITRIYSKNNWGLNYII